MNIMMPSATQRLPSPRSRSDTTSPPPMLRNTTLKALPPRKRSMTVQVVRSVARLASRSTGQVNLWLKAARTSAPTHPMPAASVAGATPAGIVPITRRIRAKGGTKLLSVMPHFWAVV